MTPGAEVPPEVRALPDELVVEAGLASRSGQMDRLLVLSEHARALLDALDAAERDRDLARQSLIDLGRSHPFAEAAEQRLAAVRALADEWATEGPSLVEHAHGGRDVHEGSTLERCAASLRAALGDADGGGE